MHEMSLCESILGILEDHARGQGFRRVTGVWLEVGALAGVEPEALRFSFEVVTRGTLAEQARLEIIEVPGQAWCVRCERNVPVSQRFDACPRCGGFGLQLTAGDELRVKELEVS